MMNQGQPEFRYFEVIAPAQWTLPVVLNSPHSGDHIPKDLLLQSGLTEIELRRSEDRFVDELFSGCVTYGAPMLKAMVSRAYVDLNREPYELDPAMFGDPLPVYANTSSPRVIAGLGTIPKIVGDGQLIYRRKLDTGEALQRIDRVYRPYHRILTSLVSQIHQRQAFACLIDCHSMPPTTSNHAPLSHRTPDIVLGDRHGGSCGHKIVDSWRSGFESLGLRVKMNHPYPGGFITESFGQPRQGRHALQIEINRSLYLTPSGLEKNSDFNKLKIGIEAVFEKFSGRLPQFTDPQIHRKAAE